MLAQIFVVGGAAKQRILPSQNKRQKVLGSGDASADSDTVRVAPDVHGKHRVERIVGKRVVVDDEIPAGGTATSMAEEVGDAKVDEMDTNDAVKQKDSRVEYLVKWYGLGDANATWEPAAVSSCARL
jgi:cytochrome oxidase assembly protein ShyY1